MITKFDSSYYGTADMENLGYTGTPINERRYPQEQFAKALRKVVAYAKCMDERGYNTFWMAEHHFQPEGTELIPNLLMMAMHLVNNTKNLKIGCGFNVVPMWHPLRLAEDYAMADILSGGRGELGLGAGAHSYRDGHRWWNVRPPLQYLETVGAGRLPRGGEEWLSPEDRRLEQLLLALRTTSGVPLADVEPSRADEVVQAGLAERDGARLRPTEPGLLMANDVLLTLLG